MSVWDLFERQILRQTKTTNQTGSFFTELGPEPEQKRKQI